jgi:RHS repeat-associated protein
MTRAATDSCAETRTRPPSTSAATNSRSPLASQKVTGTRYYASPGGAPTIVRTTDAVGTNKLGYEAGDHHGTATTTLDAATLAITRRNQKPYGEDRGTPPATWPDDKGFLGKPKDTTGLTHIGAREYDPGLGRFISVDPVMDLADPQQMHGYGYANGNPVSLSDPTGTKPDDCRDHACTLTSGEWEVGNSSVPADTYGGSSGGGDSGGPEVYGQEKHPLGFRPLKVKDRVYVAPGVNLPADTPWLDEFIHKLYSQKGFAYCEGKNHPETDCAQMMVWQWKTNADLACEKVKDCNVKFISDSEFFSESLAAGIYGSQAVTPQQFAAAVAIIPWASGGPSSGRIDPATVRFSQDSVSSKFKNGNTIDETAAGLKSGTISSDDFPQIRLVYRNGNLYTLDNRRLVAFQQAGLKSVKFRMATEAEAAAEGFKFTTVNEGQSIFIRGANRNWRP